MVIAMAAIIGPINSPRMPNWIIPASVAKTVIKVWSSALLWFIVLESFLIINGRAKLSIKVPANTTPKNKIINALAVSPMANRYSDKGSQTSRPPSTGMKPAKAIETPKNNADKPTIEAPTANTKPCRRETRNTLPTRVTDKPENSLKRMSLSFSSRGEIALIFSMINSPST